MKYDVVKWLTTVPSGDCNFKSALKIATAGEIRTAINALAGQDGVKTKLNALERELLKKLKQEGKENDEQRIHTESNQ